MIIVMTQIFQQYKKSPLYDTNLFLNYFIDKQANYPFENKLNLELLPLPS